jgi:hypothetical protein
MLVAFEQLPESARLWVYQSNRTFTQKEEGTISFSLTNFCNQWEAHGSPLAASFKIEFHQFVVLAVDENMHEASGCSIDSSVRVLKEIQNQLNLDLLNRSVAFLINDKVELYSITQVKSLIASGELKEDSITFNNAVSTKKEYLKSWKIATQNSPWLAKYLPKKALVQ